MRQYISLVLMVALYVLAGINHFVHPFFYMDYMPPYLPDHLQLIYISGACEIILGILLVPKQTRKLSALLIILMLIVFLAFHVQMIIDTYPKQDKSYWLAVVRFPLQFLLIYWAWTLSSLKLKAESRKLKAESIKLKDKSRKL